jgi:murein DD-endopeptidase MepM/ murein hydrolase activator NlpD
LVGEITRIFAWDIDFFRDPRPGDGFQILAEKRFRQDDGRFLGYGRVLAARYENAGRSFGAVLYRDRYYTPEGKGLEKQLMKVPLRYNARVSSGFSSSRLHPVLGVRRPHWGVDYAGPTGTPILAAGSGTIAYAKWVNGYGKTIKIRHNGVYSTYYAHLHGYAPGISAGKRVAQGDVIGYMGSTGLSTGPHLDYRVEKNGRYVNPLTVISDPVAGVSASELPAFLSQRDRYFALLAVEQTRLARHAAPDSALTGG